VIHGSPYSGHGTFSKVDNPTSLTIKFG